MSTTPPRRRFLPEPVESSVRSSKRPHSEEPNPISHVRFSSAKVESHAPVELGPTAAKPRRFIPQPIEGTTRTSRKSRAEHVEDASARGEEEEQSAVPKRVQPTGAGLSESKPSKNTSRRFAPEPVETTKSSSRRKFAPEPVESSTRSSKDKRQKEQPDSTQPPARRKFLPEPVETSSTSRRRKSTEESDSDEYGSPAEEDTALAFLDRTRTSSSGRRKFTPELVEVAKGSYRRKQVSSGTTSPKKTKPQHPSPSPSVADEAIDTVPEIQESRFSAASLARRQHAQRQHSFCVPHLSIIESDESDDSSSNPPSLSDTPSDSAASIDIRQQPGRQTGEDSYTDYVLQLAAKTAQKQHAHKVLQDQAMAAYINERPYEPVAHFGYGSEDDNEPVHIGQLSGDGVDARTFRRDSVSDLDWELGNMRRHHAQLEEMKRDLKENTAGQSRFSAAALMSRHHREAAAKSKQMKTKKGPATADDVEEDNEMRKMRTAASPPMLGGDLVFPMTISPKMTRCDVDQVPRPRTAEKDDGEEIVQGDPALWNANIHVTNQIGAGLWMGMCQKTADTVAASTKPPTPMRSGIQTPAHETRNPFETATPDRPGTPGGAKTPGGTRRGGKHVGLTWLPLTPPRDKEREKERGKALGEDIFTAHIDEKLNMERQIEDEFPNSVITQIYNYLSLGYPSLAHPFDEELYKISRIPVEELRKDDMSMDAKGYVGAPEGDGVDDEFVERGKCRRWEALRLYVREWARQSPQFKEDVGRMRQGAGDWGGAGARVRRGSWAH